MRMREEFRLSRCLSIGSSCSTAAPVGVVRIYGPPRGRTGHRIGIQVLCKSQVVGWFNDPTGAPLGRSLAGMRELV